MPDSCPVSNDMVIHSENWMDMKYVSAYDNVKWDFFGEKKSMCTTCLHFV